MGAGEVRSCAFLTGIHGFCIVSSTWVTGYHLTEPQTAQPITISYLSSEQYLGFRILLFSHIICINGELKIPTISKHHCSVVKAQVREGEP